MATLSGEATLTTTTSFGTIDDVVLGSAVAQSHTTATKSPCALEAILIAPGTTTEVGWETNSNGGMNRLNRSGSFSKMLGGDQAINYTDDDYTSDNYYTEDDPLTYSGGTAGFSSGLYSDRFVFDFQDIVEEATTNITSLTITATITASGSSSTSDIGIHSTAFGTSGLTASRTLTANGQTTVSWTTTGIGTGHSGSFLPAWVAFKCTDNPQTFQYDDVTMQITFTGKTLLRSGVVENDSITYKHINGSSPVTYDGVTYAAGAEVRIGHQIWKAYPWNNGTDELTFNWNAGRFTNRGEGYTVEGMSIKEYIQMVNGSSSTPDITNPDTVWGVSRFAITDAVNYQMTQGGSPNGAVFTAQKRLWKADNSTGDVTPNAGIASNHDALAVPNFLGDQSVSNIDNDDISTAITLTTEYTSADVDDRYLQHYSSNANNEIEFRNGQKGSPTGNTAYKDLYSADFGGGSYTESYRNYRSTPIPRNTKAFLEFFWRPTLTATPDTLDLSTTWTNSGLIGITHGMTSSDVGTYTATSSASAFGGFLLEGASTPTASFTADFRGGFKLSVIEEETTTATLTATANVSITAESSITSTATASIDGSLVFFPDWGTQTVSFSYSQTDSGLGIIHGMTLSDVGAMTFTMSGVVVGAKVDEPDPFRAHTFISQTRSMPVSAQTRISTVAQQTRSIPVAEQTRIATAKQQSSTITISSFEQVHKWSDFENWIKKTANRVHKITGYNT